LRTRPDLFLLKNLHKFLLTSIFSGPEGGSPPTLGGGGAGPPPEALKGFDQTVFAYLVTFHVPPRSPWQQHSLLFNNPRTPKPFRESRTAPSTTRSRSSPKVSFGPSVQFRGGPPATGATEMNYTSSRSHAIFRTGPPPSPHPPTPPVLWFSHLLTSLSPPFPFPTRRSAKRRHPFRPNPFFSFTRERVISIPRSRMPTPPCRWAAPAPQLHLESRPRGATGDDHVRSAHSPHL